MQDFRGDNGEILDVAPDTIVIANDYELKEAVFSSLGADKDPATSNNAFNYQYGRWNIIIWPYLKEFLGSVTSPWILLDSRYSKEYGGAVWLDRTNLEVRSTLDEDTNANVWRGYARFVAGFNDGRCAAVGGITGGTQRIGTYADREGRETAPPRTRRHHDTITSHSERGRDQAQRLFQRHQDGLDQRGGRHGADRSCPVRPGGHPPVFL